MTCLLALAATVGTAGCFLSKEEADSSPDKVVGGGDTAAVLKSTLLLDTGCTATKVGPKHLLVAARCVMNNPAFAVGKKITFKAASEATASRPTPLVPQAPTDAGQGTGDASSGADAGDEADDEATDAGAPRDGGARADGGATEVMGDREFQVAEVKINASYEAKCADDACEFTRLAASDAKDIAVVILSAALESVPTIPIDLDAVSDGDPLLALGSGCERLDSAPVAVKTTKTVAAPAKSVNHRGSAYLTKPQLVTRLGAAYVVTAGSGWNKSMPGLCNADVGAPLFRANAAAVAGVTSNFTTWEDGKLVPVTVHSTRVDTASRVGNWLTSLGVETIHSCSESPTGCVRRPYDGGAPEAPSGGGTTEPGDSGLEGDAMAPETDGGSEPDADAPTGELPDQGEQQPLPEYPDDDSYSDGEDYDYGDAAAPKKKKKKDEGGCSAAPGGAGSSPLGSAPIAIGLVVAAALARRRKRQAQ